MITTVSFIPALDIFSDDPQNLVSTLQLLLLLTVLTLAPSILILMTCFTIVIIVL
jgi:flagellar biosynthetic protein FliP